MAFFIPMFTSVPLSPFILILKVVVHCISVTMYQGWVGPSVSTSVWLPVHARLAINFLRDEKHGTSESLKLLHLPRPPQLQPLGMPPNMPSSMPMQIPVQMGMNQMLPQMQQGPSNFHQSGMLPPPPPPHGKTMQ